MSIVGLFVVKSNSDSEGSNPIILSDVSDLNQVNNFFPGGSAKQVLTFFSRTIAKRTPPGRYLSILHQKYKAHAYNRNGLCALGFVDNQYPLRAAFTLLNHMLDEYQKNFGDSWKTAQADNTKTWPYLNEAFKKFQDPTEADKLKVQEKYDETKIIHHKTIDSVLAPGENLQGLMLKSSDLKDVISTLNSNNNNYGYNPRNDATYYSREIFHTNNIGGYGLREYGNSNNSYNGNGGNYGLVERRTNNNNGNGGNYGLVERRTNNNCRLVERPSKNNNGLVELSTDNNKDNLRQLEIIVRCSIQ